MKETRKDDLMRKIQGLLAKAESSTHEGERDAFFAKAEELMMKYRIEMWELQQHQVGRISEREPIVKDFDYGFAFESGPFPEIHDALWRLFYSVGSYTNCILVFHKQHYSGERKQYVSNVIPVIGTETDLAYMELLFSSLMTQLIEKVRPHYDPDKDYYRNLQTFREAGWNWLETAKIMQDHGFHTDVTTDKARHLTAHAYRRWCKRMNVPQDYANWKTYRRNFADGFATRVASRLSEMRDAQNKVKVDGTGMDLVLREQRDINREFMGQMFPDMGQRGTLVKGNSRKFDTAAYNSGQSAGNRANISSHPGRGVKPGSGKQIGS
jgi:hypothetical protein